MDEKLLINNTEPIRQFVLAHAIFTLFESGLFDLFKTNKALTPEETSKKLYLDPDRCLALLQYLAAEELLIQEEGLFSLANKAIDLESARPWYTMFVGGYSPTLLNFPETLKLNSPPAPRNGAYLGLGSGAIGHYDSNPVLVKLLQTLDLKSADIFDFGCGNGSTLVEICQHFPEVKCVGFEPNELGYAAAKNHVRNKGMESRITFQNISFAEYLETNRNDQPDAMIFAFVMHELIGEKNTTWLIESLGKIRKRSPKTALLVIEVDYRPLDSEAMKQGLVRNYYNPYYLLHPFTGQRLLPIEEWRDIFKRSEYRIEIELTADIKVDSTGLMHGFLLKPD